MGSSGDAALTQAARAVQADSQKFQEDLTGACLQASKDPRAALTVFDECWERADELERRELDFLSKMGDFGVRQMAPAKEGWRQNRLQVLVGRAQAHFLMAEYDAAQNVIDSARPLILDSGEPAAGILDQLEIGIIQMKG